jgi:hypothetical protein
MNDRPNLLILLAHIAAVSSLAVAQPLFDLLSRSPEFFVAHHADRLDVLALTLLIAAGPALLLAAVVAIVTLLHRAAGLRLASVVIGMLVGLLVVQMAYQVGVSGRPAALAVALAGACVATVSWWRFRLARAFLTVLAVAAFIVPAIFLLGKPIRPLLAGRPDRLLAIARRATPVVVLLFDELSGVSLLDAHGRLDAVRYPNLAALAKDGIWYSNASTVSEYTRFAMPAIVTGRYPRPNTVPAPSDHPNTLFSLLQSTHRMEVSEPITRLCPPDVCGRKETPRLTRHEQMATDLAVILAHVVASPDARSDLPDLTQAWAGFADENADAPREDQGDGVMPAWRRAWRPQATTHSDTAKAFVEGISADDPQPTLYFMHTLITHSPPRWLPSGQEIAARREIPSRHGGDLWRTDEWAVIQQYQGHLLQAGYADTLVGRICARLKAFGAYDRSLVIVTADHGASFRVGDRMRSITVANLGEIMAVPFIVKLPADYPGPPPGTVDDRNVETIDVLPTIADVVRVKPPWPVEGLSVVAPARPRSIKQLHYHDAERVWRMDLAEFTRLRDAARDRKITLFGSERWPPTRVPGFEQLIGRRLDTIDIDGHTATRRVVVHRRRALESVNLSAATLPVQITGEVQPDQRGAATYLAVALNGVVVATTRTWANSSEWMAMVPPDLLRRGRNKLEVFFIDPHRPDRLTGKRASGDL